MTFPIPDAQTRIAYATLWNATGKAPRSIGRSTDARNHSSERKPMRACEPSQNGLFAEPPHRHSRVDRVRSTVRPVPEQISTLPLNSRGPSGMGSIVSGPPRSASGSDAIVAGSPLAANPAFAWLLSQ